MKRLVGGDYLLDLSPIEIEESVDGETYTNITDKSVLDQLTGLKAFIGKLGMIKPVWVKLLNGETDEIVATRGSLSTSDGTTFLIKILLVGFILTLSVEFTQMLNEDDEPIDDWYIDTNDAKYILTSEAQEIGAISELPVFENIVDKDGHKRFVEGEISITPVEGVTQTYGKWSLSGSHLMLVLSISVADATVITYGSIAANITDIPEWILDKIIPIGGNIISNASFYLFNSDGSSTQNLPMFLRKISGDTEFIRISSGAVTLNADRSGRFQFDLLIDNEETETPAP